MSVYWIVWISIILLGVTCISCDYPLSNELTVTRVKHKNNAKLVFILGAILLIMISGCRYYVGADFGGYYMYEKYLDFWPALESLEEPGIRLIYNIAIWIHESRGMCILAVSAVTIGLTLSTFYKNTDNIGFALILFVFMCWTSSFNAMRQCLAVAVLFCGFSALREKKFWKYAFIVFLAFLCHRSAIVMLAMYFIVNRKVTAKNIVLLTIVTVILMISYDLLYSVVNIVMEADLDGTESYWSTSVNGLRILTEIAPAVLFLYFYKEEEKTPEVSFYLNLLVFHAVIGVVTSSSASIARMVLYTMPFSVIAMAELVKKLPSKNRQTISVIIVALFWAMEYYQCVSSSGLDHFDLRWFW